MLFYTPCSYLVIIKQCLNVVLSYCYKKLIRLNLQYLNNVSRLVQLHRASCLSNSFAETFCKHVILMEIKKNTACASFD